MLGQLIKWAAFAAVWTKVKPVFWGTLATVLFTVAVSAVHGEFVEFLRIDQELSGASAPLASQVRVWLVFSYLGKFALILLSTGAWLLYLKHKGCFANGKQASASDKALASATVHTEHTEHTEQPEPAPARFSKEFEFLRGDRPLRSRGQAILDAKSAA